MARHQFTPLAPEANEANDPPESLETWKWCIRCGALRLGQWIYRPGPKQKLVIVAGTGGGPDLPGNECTAALTRRRRV